MWCYADGPAGHFLSELWDTFLISQKCIFTIFGQPLQVPLRTRVKVRPLMLVSVLCKWTCRPCQLSVMRNICYPKQYILTVAPAPGPLQLIHKSAPHNNLLPHTHSPTASNIVPTPPTPTHAPLPPCPMSKALPLFLQPLLFLCPLPSPLYMPPLPLPPPLQRPPLWILSPLPLLLHLSIPRPP